MKLQLWKNRPNMTRSLEKQISGLCLRCKNITKNSDDDWMIKTCGYCNLEPLTPTQHLVACPATASLRLKYLNINATHNTSPDEDETPYSDSERATMLLKEAEMNPEPLMEYLRLRPYKWIPFTSADPKRFSLSVVCSLTLVWTTWSCPNEPPGVAPGISMKAIGLLAERGAYGETCLELHWMIPGNQI